MVNHDSMISIRRDLERKVSNKKIGEKVAYMINEVLYSIHEAPFITVSTVYGALTTKDSLIFYVKEGRHMDTIKRLLKTYEKLLKIYNSPGEVKDLSQILDDKIYKAVRLVKVENYRASVEAMISVFEKCYDFAASYKLSFRKFLSTLILGFSEPVLDEIFLRNYDFGKTATYILIRNSVYYNTNFAKKALLVLAHEDKAGSLDRLFKSNKKASAEILTKLSTCLSENKSVKLKIFKILLYYSFIKELVKLSSTGYKAEAFHIIERALNVAKRNNLGALRDFVIKKPYREFILEKQYE